MAMITISGYPASGKSFWANRLESYFVNLNSHSKVVVLSDHSLNLSPSSYTDQRLEKAARAKLFTTTQRLLANDTILILDAPNYIKGFRYQLYCAAREMKLRVATIHVVAPPEICHLRNQQRHEADRYPSETLQNLIDRFEEPSSMVRWDSPLFTFLWTESFTEFSQIRDVIVHGNLKPPNSGTLAVTPAPEDALQRIEHTVNVVLQVIQSHFSMTEGFVDVLDISTPEISKITIKLPMRMVTMAELQRLKRQFVTIHRKAISLGTTEKGVLNWDIQLIALKFVTFLEENMKRD